MITYGAVSEWPATGAKPIKAVLEGDVSCVWQQAGGEAVTGKLKRPQRAKRRSFEGAP